MPTDDKDFFVLKRQVDSIASGVFDNQRAIERNNEQNQEERREIMALLKEIHVAVFGNGKANESLVYRVTWTERVTKYLILFAIVNTVVNLIIVFIILNHLTT